LQSEGALRCASFIKRGAKSGSGLMVVFVLRFIAAGLATCLSIVLSGLVFWAIGGTLFNRGIINDATLFAFPLYGLVPGFILVASATRQS
jgi:hypothetical protein